MAAGRWWGWDRDLADWLSANRQWDKLGHSLLYAGIFCGFVSLSARSSNGARPSSWLRAGVIALGLGVLDEFVEAWKSNDAFEWADLAADLVGAWGLGPLLALGLFSFSDRRVESPTNSPSEFENGDPTRVARIDAIHGRRHHRRRVPRR